MSSQRRELAYQRVLFLIPPTGAYCREDRCQSSFKLELIPTMRPPMEECESAGAVRGAGAIPSVIDAPAEQLDSARTLARIETLAPDLVIITTTFGTQDGDLSWARKVRELLPQATIGLRGAPCFVHPERLLADAPQVEFCVRGEYEPTFAAIIARGFCGTPGTVHRSPDGTIVKHPAPLANDLDALPRPDRTVIDSSLYRVRGFGRPQATVRVQRGCPYPCSYCLVHTVSGNKARHRSPESIAEEMAVVIESGVRDFYLRADTFSLDREWTLATCAAIEKRCPTARWVTTTRVERVDDEVLAAMRGAGCYGVSFGIDVGSEAVGRQVGKKPQPEKAAAAMRACDRNGILSLGYFMIGFLWDTPETLQETAELIRHAKPDLLTIHFAHPYPGTRYFEAFSSAKGDVESPLAQARPAAATSALTTEQLETAANSMRRAHYLRPSVGWSVARKLSRLALLTGNSRGTQHRSDLVMEPTRGHKSVKHPA